MTKYVYVFLLTLLHFVLMGQHYGTAIIFNAGDAKIDYNKNIFERINSNCKKQKVEYLEYYTWNGKKGSQLQKYPLVYKENQSIEPVTVAAYVYSGYRVSEPQFYSKLDTLGKLVSAGFSLKTTAAPGYKVIDLISAELIDSKIFVDKKDYSLGGAIAISGQDLKKYFPKNTPDELKKKDQKLYDETIKNLRKRYENDIQKSYQKSVKAIASDLSEIISLTKGVKDKKIWKIKDWESGDKGKLKEFYIDAALDENLIKGEWLSLYKLTQFGDVKQYDFISNIGVKEVLPDKTKVNTFFYNRKKIKKAIESGNDIAVVRNPVLVKKANMSNEEIKRVQLIAPCFTCSAYMEKVLLNVPGVKVIERQFDGPRSYFVNQYTDEKFIDFDMDQVQGKAEGIDYIIDASTEDVTATEVETGRLVKADKGKEKGFFGKMFSFNGPELLALCLELFQEEIEIIEITDQKKNKIKRVNVYSPVGFDNLYSLKIMKLIEEKVGDRVLIRKEEIGKGNIKERYSSSLVELKIKDGKKQLFKALEEGYKIAFSVL